MIAKMKGWSPQAVKIFLWIFLLVSGLSVWLLSFHWTPHERVWRALLISFLYFTPLSGGMVVWLAIVKAADGKWAKGYEYKAAVGIVFFLPSVIALLVLWSGSSGWAPWYHSLTPQGFWLNNTFLFTRQLVVLLFFWASAWFFLKKYDSADGRKIAGIFILIFCLIFTLIAFDLVMSLDYHWHSSLFGGYFFISSLYIAIAAWGFTTTLLPDSDPEVRHILGTLLLSFSILTTYMMFCQLLPIWYENLPSETRFLYDRLHFSPAREISFILLGIVYLGPLALLLTKKARTGRLSLGLISALILVFMWLERWWLVAPTFSEHPAMGTAEISIALAFLGALGAGSVLYSGNPAIKGENRS